MYTKCLILLAVVSCAVLIADARSVKDLKGKVIPDSLKSLIADPREAKRYFPVGKRNTKTHVKRDGDSGDDTGDDKRSGGSSNDSGGSDSGGNDSKRSGGSSNDSGGSDSGGNDSKRSGGSSNDSGGSDSGGSDSN